jgi:chromate transporter
MISEESASSQPMSAQTATAEKNPHVTWSESFRVWVRVALLSFGGPAAQIAVMHRILVDEKKWLDERRFLNSLNFCMLLPGPEAQQLATYIGWLLHGVRGGLMAGLLFILPGFVSILALSFAYVSLAESTSFQSLFFGLKCAVLAVVAEAVVRVGKRVLHNSTLISIAVISFLVLWLKLLPFPAVIGVAALTGLIGHRISPSRFQPKQKSKLAGTEGPAIVLRDAVQPTIGRSLLVVAICVTLWFAPIFAMANRFGRDSVFVQSSVFFSKAAVVTFGGAYSVLSYVDEQAVNKYRWIEKGEMLDGLGMAETTPGPLIMVVQFVGFLAAYRHGPEHALTPLMSGTIGAVLTTWVTFVPCFLWIFLGAPYMEKLLEKRWLTASLTAITAAVVGVIATLGINLMVSTLFRESSIFSLGPGVLIVPAWSSLQFDALSLAILAGVLLLVFHRSLALTLTVCVIVGFVIRAIL